jgi:tetratricopeptide (TPR) repeat protein
LNEKAWHLWEMRSEDNLGDILECFRAALREDWSDAASYAGLACALLASSVWNLIQGSIALLQARAAVEKALALEPSLAEARCAAAWIQLWHLRDTALAATGFQDVLGKKPDCSFALTGLAWLYAILGESDRSAALIDDILQKGSFSRYSTSLACRIYFLNGEFRKVLHIAAQANASRSAGRVVRSLEALSLLKVGESEKAILSLENESYTYPEDAMVTGSLGYAYGVSGDIQSATRTYHILQSILREQVSGCGYPLAMTAMGLGREEEAVQWLEQSFQEQSFAALTLGIDPLFAGLRGNPRFDRLLRQIRTPASIDLTSPIFPRTAREFLKS